MISNLVFSVLITTKNRKDDLAFTFSKMNFLLQDKTIEFVVFDDGSTDGTYDYIRLHYPTILIHRNVISKGYIYCRNKMLNETQAIYAISLDDDAHFITQKPLEAIKNHFDKNSNCGLLALRIFWGRDEPFEVVSSEKINRVQGFVGCAHVWRMEAWRSIPNYPEWFVFYGEEDFASYQLFKKKWEIHYFPEVLVHHRVDVKSRKNNTDYVIRLRRSLRTGWYLFFLFYPFYVVPRKMAYSLWMQFKLKVFQGDFKALQAILLALMDLVWNIPKIVKSSNRLTNKEYSTYGQLPETKIYWRPEID
jgi:glycosyltransferase involved in cell wall biosynthesis